MSTFALTPQLAHQTLTSSATPPPPALLDNTVCITYRVTNGHLSIFQEHPAVKEGLDLVDEEDQFTHMLTLDDAVNDERMLGNIIVSHYIELY